MRRLLVITAAIACGSSVARSPSGGSSSSTFQLRVEKVGDGSGSVVSEPAGIDCGAVCSASFAAGTTVALRLVVGGDSEFVGFGGTTCTGNGDCRPVLDADSAVWVHFRKKAPLAGKVTLTVSVTGTGVVNSFPAGIACPGTCSAQFPAGSSVRLAGVPGKDAALVGWSGSCTGGGDCTVSLGNGDVAIEARFGSAPPAECATLMPDAALAMRQYVRPMSVTACLSGSSDASGTLMLATQDPFVSGGTGAGHVSFVSAEGKLLREVETGPIGAVVEQSVGLATLHQQARPFTSFGAWVTGWDSAGTRFSSSAMIGALTVLTAPDPRGGMLVAGSIDPKDVTNPKGPPSAMLYSTPGDGSATVHYGPVPVPGGNVVAAGVALDGSALVLTYDDSSTNWTGQWLDGQGKLLGAAFVLVTAPKGNTSLRLAQTADGGFAVRRMTTSASFQLSSEWIGILGPAERAMHPAPDWLKKNGTDSDLRIVRGGRGYALVPMGHADGPCTQGLTLVTAAGAVCGEARYAIAAGSCGTKDLTLGADGTVFQQLPTTLETQPAGAGGATCTWRYWPAALK